MKKTELSGGKECPAGTCVCPAPFKPRSRSGVAVIAALPPVSLRSLRSARARRNSASRFSSLTCALSSDHFLRRLPSGVTAPAVLLPAAPANI